MHGRPRLRPWEIDRLTLAELAILLDQDIENLDKRPPVGAVDMSGFTGGVDEYAKWWRSRTPQQRLERARTRWEEEK